MKHSNNVIVNEGRAFMNKVNNNIQACESLLVGKSNDMYANKKRSYSEHSNASVEEELEAHLHKITER